MPHCQSWKSYFTSQGLNCCGDAKHPSTWLQRVAAEHRILCILINTTQINPLCQRATYHFGLFWTHRKIQDGLSGDGVFCLCRLQDEGITKPIKVLVFCFIMSFDNNEKNLSTQAAHLYTPLIGYDLLRRFFGCLLLWWRRTIRSEPPEEWEVGQSQRHLQRVPEHHLHYDWLCRDTTGQRPEHTSELAPVLPDMWVVTQMFTAPRNSPDQGCPPLV